MSQTDDVVLPCCKKSKVVLISLSTENLVEILRHLSRKELCRLIYPVNRQFYHLATSSAYLPTIHQINKLHFYRIGLYSRSESPQQFIAVKGSMKICLLATEFLEKMPLPKPFIRFRKVRVEDSVTENVVVKFLSDSKKSFVGCKLVISSSSNRATCDERVQTLYLLENVFNRPASVSIDGGYLMRYSRRQGKISTLGRTLDTVINCNKLQINFTNRICNSMRPTQDIGHALLRWLKSQNQHDDSLQSGGMKHLILIRYPQALILEMVNQFRQEFENAATPSLEFVITFVASRENDLGCFEEFSEGFEFFLKSVMPGFQDERLSFFKHSRFVHRLWRRRVINEADDTTMFLSLKAPKMETYWFEDDGSYYSFEYIQPQPLLH